MWTKAVWLEDGEEYEMAIPMCWIQGTSVRWPVDEDVKSAYKKRLSPEENWKRFPLIKIKYSSESFKAAKAYNDTTTVEDSDDCEKRSPQKRQFPGFVLPERVKQRRTQAVKERSCNQDAPSIALPQPPTKIHSQQTRPDKQAASAKSKGPVTLSKSASKNQSLSTGPLHPLNSNLTISSGRASESFPMDDGKFQKKVLLKLAQLTDAVDALTPMVKSAFTVTKCKTDDDIKNMEEKLTDTKFRANMVKSLALIGGNDIKGVVRNVLNRLFDTTLLARMNMHGRGEKRSFIVLKISKVIIESILESTKSTETEIISLIGLRLKYAPDMCGARNSAN